jgi:WD40 repeat protein
MAAVHFAILTGGLLAIASQDRTVRVVNLQRKTLMACLGMGDPVVRVGMNSLVGSNGALMVLTSVNLFYYDAANFNQLNKATPTHTNYDMAIHPTTGWIYVLAGNYMEVFDTNAQRTYYTELATVSTRLVMMPGNEYIAIGAANGYLQLHNLNDKSNTQRINDHSQTITMLELTPDKKYLVSGSTDTWMAVFDWSTKLQNSWVSAYQVSGSITTGKFVGASFTGRKKIFII